MDVEEAEEAGMRVWVWWCAEGGIMEVPAKDAEDDGVGWKR